MSDQKPMDDSVIPSASLDADFSSNALAIDQLVTTEKYQHIVAWGKWLGFTLKTVKKYVDLAEKEDAPADAVQKIDDKWIRLNDIANESNRRCVDEIATHTARQ